MTAYDYEKQQWLEGREGAQVRLAQLQQELETLVGPGAEEYVKFLGLAAAHGAAAIEVCQRGIAECEKELRGRVPEFFGDAGAEEFEPRDHNDAEGVQTMRDCG